MSGITGRCLCEAVTFEISTQPNLVGHCHCVDCRKASGSGHCIHLVISEEELTVTGEVKFYDKPADSGAVVSRGFCANCGCAILSRNSSMPGKVFPRASALDDPDAITPQMIVYASRAPKWDYMDPDLPAFSEMPEGGPQEVVKNGLPD